VNARKELEEKARRFDEEHKEERLRMEEHAKQEEIENLQ